MNVSVILAHPNQESFNHAIARTGVEALSQNGYNIFFHDLYAEQFDPILPHHEFEKDAHLPPEIEMYCREISSSDGIIIVHPNWWGQPPAILKGWVDRVIRPGVAYQFLEGDSGEGVPIGLLKAKAALVFNTSNTPLERELQVFGDPLETLWKNCIFGLCGVHVVHREMFKVIVTSTAKQRREWLEKVQELVKKYFDNRGKSCGGREISAENGSL
jgi:NAD(P)H dehydrogenase (quinone)